MIKVGDKAPELNLYNTEKEKINLDRFKGKNLILFFFPLSFSWNCTQEMCILSEDYQEYQKLNVEVVGISVDSLYSLKKFKEIYNLSSIMFLSDFNKKIIESYGVTIEDFAFEYERVSKRATFIIDKDGRIVYIEILSEPSQLPNFVEIKKFLEKL